MKADKDKEIEILVLRSRQGNEEALGRLVTLLQDRLWRHAFRITGNEAVAADILQDTWLSIVRQLTRLERPSAFRAWAFQIASNRAYDWVRRETRRRSLLSGRFEHAGDQLTDAAGVPERITALHEALESLPATDRTILGLKYEEGFTVSEIGVIIGIPQGTVKSRLHQARRQLRRMMEEVENERE